VLGKTQQRQQPKEPPKKCSKLQLGSLLVQRLLRHFYNRFKHGYWSHCGLKTEAENNKDDIVTKVAKGPSSVQLQTPMIQSR